MKRRAVGQQTAGRRANGLASRLTRRKSQDLYVITIVISHVEYRFSDRFLYFAALEAVWYSVVLSLPLPSAWHDRSARWRAESRQDPRPPRGPSGGKPGCSWSFVVLWSLRIARWLLWR